MNFFVLCLQSLLSWFVGKEAEVVYEKFEAKEKPAEGNSPVISTEGSKNDVKPTPK